MEPTIPKELKLINPNKLEYIPANNTEGDYTINLSLFDGISTVPYSFILTVIPNKLPAFSTPLKDQFYSS